MSDALKQLIHAEQALMLCPAPDLPAVLYKLEIAKEECLDIHDIAPALADLRRLAGGV